VGPVLGGWYKGRWVGTSSLLYLGRRPELQLVFTLALPTAVHTHLLSLAASTTTEMSVSPSPSPDPYVLGRSAPEARRLDNQHDIWTRIIGSLLPSHLPALPPSARIADLGSGTGIWLRSLAAVSPASHSFVGFDISPALFPPPSELPRNLSMRVADFKNPFPAEEHGTYDVVNIRLIIITLGPEPIWRSVLAHALALLKPGGVLVWTEGDFFSARGYRGAEPDSPTGAHLLAAQEMFNGSLVKRFGYWFPSSFAGLLRDAGLVNVSQEIISTDRHVALRREITETGVGAAFGGLARMASEGAKGTWGVDEVERRRKLAVADMDGGAYLRWDIHVVVGFKATS
jgi:SAM-dependent methyltransferase